MANLIISNYLNMLLSEQHIEPVKWGLSYARMGCHQGDGIEVWDTSLNRVFSTMWILEKEFEAQRDNPWGYIWRKLDWHVADAIYNRALWRKYHKMPHELTDEQKDNVI